MAIQLTETTRALSQQIGINPQIILEIDGIPIIFGAVKVESQWRFDEGFEFDTPGLRFDTPIEDPNSRSYISLNKTSKNISQQIVPDKGAASSSSTMAIEIVDRNREVTGLFKFGENVPDILGRNATVYLGFKGGSHPTDSVPVLSGFISKYSSANGTYLVTVSHAENLKRQKIYTRYDSELSSSITDSQTLIPVSSTLKLLPSADILTTYIIINDEIMLVSSIGATDITVVRAQQGTTAAAHDIEDQVSSLYNLVADPIDMILKIYMSDAATSSFGSEEINAFNQLDVSTNIPGAIYFQEIDVQTKLGLVVGDSVVVTGAINPGNNGTFLIDSFVITDNGSYIQTSETFTNETDSTASCSFISKFNVLPDGLGLSGREVDISAHMDITTFNPDNFPIMDFSLDEEIEAKEFIDKDICFTNALYAIPRKSKISLKLVQPPLSLEQTVTINETNITNIGKVTIDRSSQKFLYNSIVYKYEKQRNGGRFLRGAVFINDPSRERIQTGNKQLTIIANGLRSELSTESFLKRQSLRIFDRYKFAAQLVRNVEILFKDGFNIEVGDVIIFGSDNLQIGDLETGERAFTERLMEVSNKTLNIVNGKIKLELLETSFLLNARYGIVSPSSFIDSGSTNTNIRIKTSFFTGEYPKESDKWKDYKFLNIRVRNDDYTFDEEVKFDGVNESNDNELIVSPPLSQVPQEDWSVEIPVYSDVASQVDDLYKDLFVYFVEQAVITTAIDNQSFEADPNDLVVGSSVYIHSETYIRDSFADEEVVIDSIVGNTITLNKALDFIPQVGDLVERSNFKDEGFPYLII